MELYIHDANILIDIVQLNVVEAFLNIQTTIYTTDFVFAELDHEQQLVLDRPEFIRLITEGDDLQAVFKLFETYKGLSMEDCSVLHFSEKMKGCLISGDGKLRKVAQARQIEVRGIIYILEQIKVQGLLSLDVCIAKLKELKNINDRLPKVEIDSRIQEWQLELDHRGNP